MQRSAPDWDAARRRMVDEQLRARDISSPRVLEAMLAVQSRATGHTIDGSGHLLPLDRPIDLADAPSMCVIVLTRAIRGRMSARTLSSIPCTIWR